MLIYLLTISIAWALFQFFSSPLPVFLKLLKTAKDAVQLAADDATFNARRALKLFKATATFVNAPNVTLKTAPNEEIKNKLQKMLDDIDRKEKQAQNECIAQLLIEATELLNK